MQKDSQILIGVFHAERSPWSHIATEGQIPTWVKSSPESVDVVYCSGSLNFGFIAKIDTYLEKLRWHLGSRISTLRNYANLLLATPFSKIQPNLNIKVNENSQDRRIILRTNFPDLYVTTRWRRIALLRYFLENQNYSHLVTTTSSSYINIECLQEEINSNTPKILYGGAIQYPGTPEAYAMGSFIVLNREAAKIILSDLKKYPIELLDDIGLGKAAFKLGIKATEFKSLTVTLQSEIANLSERELNSTSHFKLKSGNLENRKDVGLFHALHNRICILREKNKP